MKKALLISSLITFFIGPFYSQVSVSAGTTMIKTFGTTPGIKSYYPGFHLALEFNDDDVMTKYVRFSFAPTKSTGDSIFTNITAKDFLTQPYQIKAAERLSYSVLEFGKRYYFGDGYESGFGLYGCSNISIVFNKFKYKTREYDASLYDDAGDATNGTAPISVIGLALGLNGGVKKSFYFGTIYFDAGVNYSLFSIPSASLSTNSFSSLFFALNLGIRKDFY